MRIRYRINLPLYEKYFKDNFKSIREMARKLKVPANYIIELHRTGLCKEKLAEALVKRLGKKIVIERVILYHKPIMRIGKNILKGVDEDDGK